MWWNMVDFEVVDTEECRLVLDRISENRPPIHQKLRDLIDLGSVKCIFDFLIPNDSGLRSLSMRYAQHNEIAAACEFRYAYTVHCNFGGTMSHTLTFSLDDQYTCPVYEVELNTAVSTVIPESCGRVVSMVHTVDPNQLRYEVPSGASGLSFAGCQELMKYVEQHKEFANKYTD